jgi:hypothetical protein
MHPSLTLSRIVGAVKRSMRDDTYPGFCTTCGRKAKQSCEPDAQGFVCRFTTCGQPTVYGAEQLLLMMDR